MRNRAYVEAEPRTYRSMDEFLAEVDQWRSKHPLQWRLNQFRSRLRSALYQIRHIRWAYQRVTRGWDDRALWSLDHHLARTLGAQLLWLADHGHGYPCDTTAEKWTTQLRTHGQALADYAAADSLDNTVDPLAAEAIHWVADNLGSLWD